VLHNVIYGRVHKFLPVQYSVSTTAGAILTSKNDTAIYNVNL